ncbi:MAG: 4Fe-4S dicluster domain-containing protein [Bacteroidota bacterium]|nr:4Fe-4S dicluster domain-containing protein [Bacteroidota bacterium]
MKDFGYTINPDRQINYDQNSKEPVYWLETMEPSVNICISCGGCTATCSARQFTDFNIRKVHTLMMRGETHSLKKEIKKCMLCGKCQTVCPRGVNLRNLILSIHKILEFNNL